MNKVIEQLIPGRINARLNNLNPNEEESHYGFTKWMSSIKSIRSIGSEVVVGGALSMCLDIALPWSVIRRALNQLNMPGYLTNFEGNCLTGRDI